jgi:hypothetical protein
MDQRIKRSRMQEKRVARAHGGTVNSGSGNGPWRKGDVRCDDYLVEAKRTDRASWTLKASEWETIRRHALNDGRLPMICLELGGRNLVIVEECDLPGGGG